jgi:hypothetical protein
MFSLYLGFTDQDSKIWLGGFDHEQIRKSLSGQANFNMAAEIKDMTIDKSYESMTNR